MNRLAKLMRENDNIFEKESVDAIAEKRRLFREEIIDVAMRFARQIESIFHKPKADFDFLQERVKKASAYFFEKLNDLENINEFINETDNKTVNVSVKAVIDLIKEMLYVKTACLDIAKNGFDIEKYLEMKNKKTVEAENLKSYKLKSKSVVKKDKPLMNALLKWREEKAYELEKPEAQILPKTVIDKIVELKPAR